jgi:hypothetical protein
LSDFPTFRQGAEELPESRSPEKSPLGKNAAWQGFDRFYP